MTRTLTFDSSEAPKNQQSSPFRNTEIMQEEIRMRAYELYEAGGRRDGHHEDDWLRAEKEIRDQNRFRKAA